MGPQFIVVFRGVEVGRYERADWAVSAAQSIIDTELGARFDAPAVPPRDLPQIFWQPPPMYFPFDAAAYWYQQAARPQYPPAPAGNQLSQDAPPLPENPELPSGLAIVYGGPPAPPQRDLRHTDYGQARPHEQAPEYGGSPAPYEPAPQAPVYGGPPAPR